MKFFIIVLVLFFSACGSDKPDSSGFSNKANFDPERQVQIDFAAKKDLEFTKAPGEYCKVELRGKEEWEPQFSSSGFWNQDCEDLFLKANGKLYFRITNLGYTGLELYQINLDNKIWLNLAGRPMGANTIILEDVFPAMTAPMTGKIGAFEKADGFKNGTQISINGNNFGSPTENGLLHNFILEAFLVK